MIIESIIASMAGHHREHGRSVKCCAEHCTALPEAIKACGWSSTPSSLQSLPTSGHLTWLLLLSSIHSYSFTAIGSTAHCVLQIVFQSYCAPFITDMVSLRRATILGAAAVVGLATAATVSARHLSQLVRSMLCLRLVLPCMLCDCHMHGELLFLSRWCWGS